MTFDGGDIAALWNCYGILRLCYDIGAMIPLLFLRILLVDYTRQTQPAVFSGRLVFLLDIGLHSQCFLVPPIFIFFGRKG